MFDIIALGEALIDFTVCGESENGQQLFEQNPGGAPANVAVAASRLGMKTAFIGKVGDDAQGRFLIDTLDRNGVDVTGMVKDEDYFTTLAFVSLENGERTFSFARKHGADTQLIKEDIPEKLPEQTKIFHFGSLSLTHEESRGATLYALWKSRMFGAISSYDPNYRASLWENEEQAKEQMRSVIGRVDMIKLAEEECSLMTDEANPELAAKKLLDQGVRYVFITLGNDGSMMMTKDFCIRQSAKSCSVVDTTGAGDAFWGAILAQFAEAGYGREQEPTREDGERMLKFANAAAALCIGKHGGIPGMPERSEVEKNL